MSNNIRVFVYIIIVPIVISVLFIIYGLYKYFSHGDKKPNVFSSSRPGVISAFGVSLFFIQFILFGFILRHTAYNFAERNPNVKNTITDIASINLNSNTSGSLKGSFILGSGFISGESNIENYFYFYVKDEDGRYKLDKLNAEDVLLEETDKVNPSVLVSNTYNVIETVPTKFGRLLGFRNESREYLDESLNKTIIRIPVGSIVQEYNPNF